MGSLKALKIMAPEVTQLIAGLSGSLEFERSSMGGQGATRVLSCKCRDTAPVSEMLCTGM